MEKLTDDQIKIRQNVKDCIKWIEDNIVPLTNSTKILWSTENDHHLNMGLYVGKNSIYTGYIDEDCWNPRGTISLRPEARITIDDMTDNEAIGFLKAWPNNKNVLIHRKAEVSRIAKEFKV